MTSRLYINHLRHLHPAPYSNSVHFLHFTSAYASQALKVMDRRVRTGCLTCLRRRLKCDEAKPFCNRCSTGNFVCEGYRPPRRVPQASSSSQSLSLCEEQDPSRELSWKHPHWRQEQLPLYHHFVTATAVRLFRNDHVGFWRDHVAQISAGSDLVYQALLSVGAIHRGLLLGCQDGGVEEASRSRVLGLKSYGVTLRLLSNYLRQEKKPDLPVLLIVLILLTYFEVGYIFPTQEVY